MFGPSEPLGGVRNLQVLNPTMTTLNVRWEPAEGRVKEYKVLYVPTAGGPESMEEQVGQPSAACRPCCPPHYVPDHQVTGTAVSTCFSNLHNVWLNPDDGVGGNHQHAPAGSAARHPLHRVCGAALRGRRRKDDV